MRFWRCGLFLNLLIVTIIRDQSRGFVLGVCVFLWRKGFCHLLRLVKWDGFAWLYLKNHDFLLFLWLCFFGLIFLLLTRSLVRYRLFFWWTTSLLLRMTYNWCLFRRFLLFWSVLFVLIAAFFEERILRGKRRRCCIILNINMFILVSITPWKFILLFLLQLSMLHLHHLFLLLIFLHHSLIKNMTDRHPTLISARLLIPDLQMIIMNYLKL